MTNIHSINWRPKEWLEDTSNLTPEERGVYDTIMMIMYARNDSYIDDDDKWLSNRCNCSSRKLRSIKKSLIEKDFIQLSGSKIHQKTVESELNFARTRIESAMKAGRKSAELRCKSSKINDLISTGTKVGVATNTDTDTDTNTDSNKRDIPKGIPKKKKNNHLSEFEDFWKTYPRRGTESKKMTLASWKKAMDKTTPDIIMKSLEGYIQMDDVIKGYQVQANRWLERESWDLEPVIKPQSEWSRLNSLSEEDYNREVLGKEPNHES